MQSTSMDMFSKCQKETMDNLDQANQEIEKLHKYIDKQQTELQGKVYRQVFILPVSVAFFYGKFILQRLFKKPKLAKEDAIGLSTNEIKLF